MSRSKLSDFIIEGKLGSGSFGTVYRAERIRDNTTYVIKTISIGELSLDEQMDAINEVKLLASVESPHVVKYFDSFVESDTLYIVMEFCDRGDLKQLLKRKKNKNENALESTRTWSLFLQICLGLYDIHRQKVLHRDMKTANVFLSKPGNNGGNKKNYLVKIGDLGVAKLLGTSTAFANTVVGTPYYLSPELCEDKPYNDKSDVWALGVILYECLTLRHPFEARNQCALILKIIKGKFPPVTVTEDVDEKLVELCNMCLTHDCKKRPSVSDILELNFVQEQLRVYNLPLPDTIRECCDDPDDASIDDDDDDFYYNDDDDYHDNHSNRPKQNQQQQPQPQPQQKLTVPDKSPGRNEFAKRIMKSPSPSPITFNPNSNPHDNDNNKPTPLKSNNKKLVPKIISGSNAARAVNHNKKSSTSLNFQVKGIGTSPSSDNLNAPKPVAKTNSVRGNRVRGNNINNNPRIISNAAVSRHQRAGQVRISKPSYRGGGHAGRTPDKSNYLRNYQQQKLKRTEENKKINGQVGGVDFIVEPLLSEEKIIQRERNLSIDR